MTTVSSACAGATHGTITPTAANAAIERMSFCIIASLRMQMDQPQRGPGKLVPFRCAVAPWNAVFVVAVMLHCRARPGATTPVACLHRYAGGLAELLPRLANFRSRGDMEIGLWIPP